MEFAQNAERLARFQREARTLASLSHPHIASIYGLEEFGGEHFLVMELIEGEDLSQRMLRGAIPLDEALSIAVQISVALESAHESGVIHRDLKPANIKLTSDRQVKLLDFGPARAVAGGAEEEKDPATSPTITAPFTAAGTILGTAAYMSPEQARGLHVDRRADIWAFGAVLFEVLSGRRLFASETVSDTLASVIKEEPNWDSLPTGAPPLIIALIRRSLQKDLKPRLRKFILQPEDLNVAYPNQPALSPDRRRIAYFAGTILHIQDLHGLESLAIPESDRAMSPFWSPDGQWLGFGLRGRIYKVTATGGRPEAVCDVDFSTLDGAAWGDDGKMVLAPEAGPLRIVSDQGGDPEELFPLGAGESDYHTPTVLPGGKGLLFATHDRDGRETIELFAEAERGVLLKIPGARLEYAMWSAVAPSKTRGHIVYYRLNTNPGIWAVPFNLQSRELTGDPFVLDSDGAFPSLGRDGSLLYANTTGWGPMRLVIVDREGTIVRRLGEADEDLGRFAISPDGKSVLVENEENGNTDIWLHDIQRATRARMTFAPEDDTQPGSPDGRFLANMSPETGRNEVYLMPFPTGGGKWQVSTHGGVWPCWNPSGREIIYRLGTGSTAKMMSVSLETVPAVKLGEPKVLFSAAEAPSLQYGSGFAGYDVMPDSELLLMLEQAEFGPSRSLKLIFNEDWYAS